MSVKRSDVVEEEYLEEKFVCIRPRILYQVSKEAVRAFLKAYDKYEDWIDEGATMISLRDCVDKDLKMAICYKTEDIFDSDAELRKYLETLLCVTRLDDAMRILKGIEMDVTILDVDERIMLYDMEFLKAMNVVNAAAWKPRKLIELYLQGVKPESVRCDIELQLQVEVGDVTLKQLMKRVGEMVRRENESFVARKRVAQAKRSDSSVPEDTTKRHAETRRPQGQDQKPQASSSNEEKLKRDHHSDHKRSSEPKKAGWLPYNDYIKTVKCNYCGQFGHKEYNCKSKSSNVKQEPKMTGALVVDGDKHQPVTVPIKIGEWVTQGIVDTGAAVSCASQSFIQKATKHVVVTHLPGGVVAARMANGHIDKDTSLVELSVTIPTRAGVAASVTLPWRFVIFNDTTKDTLLLGCDILRHVGIIDSNTISMTLDKPGQVMRSEEDGLDECFHDVNFVEGTVTTDDELSKEVASIEVPEETLELIIRPILLKHRQVFDPRLPKDGAAFTEKFHIRLVDGGREKLVPRKARPMAPMVREAIHKEVLKQEELGIIRRAKGPLAWCVVAVKKKAKPQEAISVSFDEHTDGQPDDTVRITENATQIQYRLTVDFRELNAVTVKMPAPLPDIKTLLQYASGMKYFGKFDMRYGYHQALVDDETTPLMAFVTPDDYMEYLRLAQGPINGPAWFNQQTTHIFQDMLYKNVGVFFDDIFCYAKTAEEFAVVVDKVLSKCEDHRLRLKADKAVVGAKELEVLGYVLSGEGRSMSESRVQAVRSLPAPKNIKELRRVLGKFNYFMDLIPNAATMLAPLHELTKKDTPYIWTKELDDIYTDVKNKLTSETVLAHIGDLSADDDSMLVLKSDASEVGCGGVILLRRGGVDKPVCYYSHTFTDTQRRWTTYEQELYAVLLGLLKTPYTSMFKLKKFLIETDHRNLMFLSKAAETNNKLMRWLIILMEFDFDIQHVPGSTNVVADVLSRMGHDKIAASNAATTIDTDGGDGDIVTICQLDIVVEPANDGHVEDDKLILIPADTMTDEVTRRLKIRINCPLGYMDKVKEEQATERLSDQTAWDKKYRLVDNLWFCKDQARVVVPTTLRTEFLGTAHGSNLVGHTGESKTLNCLYDAGFSWPGIVQDVEGYV